MSKPVSALMQEDIMGKQVDCCLCNKSFIPKSEDESATSMCESCLQVVPESGEIIHVDTSSDTLPGTSLHQMLYYHYRF